MDDLNSSLVTRTIGFHGLPLQKIWEGERGNGDLLRLGVTNPDFSIYSARQKSLTFQDRAKRLKLHQFIAKKASELFDSKFVDDFPKQIDNEADTQIKDSFAVMPPMERFLNFDHDKRMRRFFENIQPGDLVYGQVTIKSTHGIQVKVLCTTGSASHYVSDIGVKANVPVSNLVPAVDKKNIARSYQNNDLVCCEVLEISPDSCRLVCGMRNVYKQTADDGVTQLGLISIETFPESYKRIGDAISKEIKVTSGVPHRTITFSGLSTEYQRFTIKSLYFSTPMI